MFDKIKEDVRETLTGSTPENDLRARLHADHSEVSRLIGELLATSDYEVALREDLRDQIVVGLTSHAKAEEEVVYSLLVQEADTRSDTQDAIREHGEIDRLVHQLKAADPGDPGLVDIAKQLQSTVGHHVREEENELLPKAEKEIGQEQLAALIPQFNARKAELTQELEAETEDASFPTNAHRDRSDPLGESDSRF